MAAQNSTNAVLVFESTEFDVVDLHNVPWLRGLQVATALGYQNPAQDFKNLYSRNADESTADGVLDGREIARLEQLRQNICTQVTRMLQLSLQVFTPQQQEPKP